MASVLEWGSQEYELVADPRTLPNADPAEEAYNWNDTGAAAPGTAMRWAWSSACRSSAP